MNIQIKGIKMKHILIALLTLCLPLAGAEKKRTDVEKAGYKGRVKSVKELETPIVERFGDLLRGGGAVRKISLYNKKGNEVERTRFDAQGELSAKYKYKHDEKGNKVSFVGFAANGKPIYKGISKYDEKENEVVSQDLDINGGITDTHTFRYDEKGIRWNRSLLIPMADSMESPPAGTTRKGIGWNGCSKGMDSPTGPSTSTTAREIWWKRWNSTTKGNSTSSGLTSTA
jgi:hypothetical protein